MTGIIRLMAAALPLIFLMAVLAGCAQQPASTPPASTPPASTPPAGQPPSTTPPATTPPAATSAAVSIKNFAFNPAELTVSKGAKVTWTDEDAVPHKIVSDTFAFSSDSLSNGQTFEFTFNDAGTYDYHCGIHPSMKGKIIVQ